MEDPVRCSSPEFESSDGRSTIHAVVWRSSDEEAHPRGIIQLVHGMTEYLERYDAFARYLVSQGFFVCGCDHVGHGQSVDDSSQLGVLPEEGNVVMVEDAHRLHCEMQAEFGSSVPYIMFGHSMGSFVVRSYLARYGESVDAAIICGTGFVPPFMSKFGLKIAQRMVRRKGADAYSPLLHAIADGAYANKIKNARTPFDWLSCDPAVVDAYMADPKCGFPFKASGYAALLALTLEVCQPECAQAVPPHVPLLYIAGSQDPVGDFGKGVNAAADLARAAGSTDVSVKIYEGLRHEILNEKERQQVYEDVVSWLEERI